MEVVFLGTGAGVPAKERNVTSIALQLLDERGATWLFDCGEATQHQILYTSIKPRKIEKIFITHLHGDHLFGLPGFLGSRSFQGGESLLTIYGPKGIKEFIETSISVSGTHIRYPLEIIEVDEGIIFDDNRFCVIAGRLDHGIRSLGYRIVEKDLPGALLVDKLTEMGVKPGPIYQQIKAGETVILEDGKVINGKEYVGTSQKGRIVTILGDTRYCDSSITLAANADLLIHEATFSSEDEKLAHDYYHSTTTQAAKVAVQADVKHLIITHISSRYQGDDSQKLLEESREVFEHTYLAKDFMKHEIAREHKKEI
ncbi:ribonuclease Z [Fredinandcohnia quinoae]|uniref:Ribonuclease Z n=1 Tax=Fredinandcohnia quinoae TaxID=2918902 RepID=A0AAW5EAG7_9BACI|nr:ribonuclease Z [Fredinandcohnia sp. SECRCQ15]